MRDRHTKSGFRRARLSVTLFLFNTLDIGYRQTNKQTSTTDQKNNFRVYLGKKGYYYFLIQQNAHLATRNYKNNFRV